MFLFQGFPVPSVTVFGSGKKRYGVPCTSFGSRVTRYGLCFPRYLSGKRYSAFGDQGRYGLSFSRYRTAPYSRFECPAEG